MLFSTALLIVTGCVNGANDKTLPQDLDAAYNCDRGPSIRVRFFPNQEKANLFRENEIIELAQQPSGSGFNYSNAFASIRGKGKDLTLIFKKMAPIKCVAQ